MFHHRRNMTENLQYQQAVKGPSYQVGREEGSSEITLAQCPLPGSTVTRGRFPLRAIKTDLITPSPGIPRIKRLQASERPWQADAALDSYWLLGSKSRLYQLVLLLHFGTSLCPSSLPMAKILERVMSLEQLNKWSLLKTMSTVCTVAGFKDKDFLPWLY